MLNILVAVRGSKSEKILHLSHWKMSGIMRSSTLWMEGWLCGGVDGMKVSRVEI